MDTPDKKVFYYFSDKKGGDLIQLVAHINQSRVKNAAIWISGEKQPAKGTLPKEKKPAKAKFSEDIRVLTSGAIPPWQ